MQNMIEQDIEVQNIIKEISQNVVEKIAPEEIEMFDEISDAYFNNPKLLEPKYHKEKDDPIGFGVEGIVEMMSPAAISVVTTVVGYIITQVWGATSSVLLDEYKSKLKSLFKKDNNGKNAVPISKEQLKEIKEKAMQQALASHLSEEQSNNLANALIASIVIK